MAAVPGRITIFDLDTLAPIGEIPDTGGNGVAVDPKSGHGFSSSNPVSMFDTKTLKVIKKIDVGAARPDGILFDAFNDRVYVFSHPTKDATVIDSKDGTVLGTIDLGGVPEQSPTSFEVEQNLQTMNGARTVTFDSKTNHILTMSIERGPAPPPPPGGGRGTPGAPVPGSFTILVIGK